MLDRDKSKDELIVELLTLRQRLNELESARSNTTDINCKRSKENADFYLTILDEAPALIWRAGKDAKCDWFNATWLAFTGRTLAQEVGDGWAEGVHPEDFDNCLSTYIEAFNERKIFEMEYRLRRYDGEYRWILDIGCPFKDVAGEFAGYIGYVYDITKNKEVEGKLKKLATKDSLTGLNNRHHFFELGSLLFDTAKRHNSNLTVAMIDIDNFKSINDTMSHGAGDMVLKKLGEIALTNFRSIDVIGRIGGEEFAVVLSETHCNAAHNVLERFRQAVESTVVNYGETNLSATISCGIAQLTSEDATLEELLKKADNALYMAKHQGRNRVVLYRNNHDNAD
jgi:diguanylate cyclase (GGDEF)-like protein/PAS domain S-box-containing protein